MQLDSHNFTTTYSGLSRDLKNSCKVFWCLEPILWSASSTDG